MAAIAETVSEEKQATLGHGTIDEEVSNSMNLPDLPNCQEESSIPTGESIPTSVDNNTSESKNGDDAQGESQKSSNNDTAVVSDSSPSGLEGNTEAKGASKDLCLKNHLKVSISKCPICSQSLDSEMVINIIPDKPSRPEPRSPASSESSLESELEKLIEDETPTKTEENEEMVVHQVEYRDGDGAFISTVDWDGPFNLEEARNRKKDKPKRTKHHVLEVLTVLNISNFGEHSSRRRPGPPGGRPPVTKDILDDPDVFVSLHSKQLVIRSQPFVDVLKSVVTYNFEKSIQSGYLRITEPFSILVHHLEELRSRKRYLDECAAQDETQDDNSAPAKGENVTRKHVELVLNFVEKELGESINEEKIRHQNPPATCTFRMLWFLYKPGNTVYVNADGKMDAFVIESVDMGSAVLSSPLSEVLGCKLKLWQLDFDGRCVTRCRTIKWIPSFQGERPIFSLNVIPSEFWDKEDGGKLRSQLENEGVKWYGLLAGKQMYYNGEFVGPRKQSFEGRVYIDPKGYYDIEGPPDLDIVDDTQTVVEEDEQAVNPLSGCNCVKCSEARHRSYMRSQQLSYIGNWKDYDSINPTTVKTLNIEGAPEISRHRYLICSRNLRGFIFKSRKWETLDVAFCHETKPNKNPFKRLVMPEDRKLMIESLVYKFTDPRYALDGSQVWGADFIKNKGEGQIFLLHGGPGVGKTFTAECIAEFAGRPLLALTCGDIGTDEVAMEKELGKWLKLAHKWGAVMLLDEADVFLEKRMHSDLKRNSLVSVFLREIEYYQGILFLTTNRVGQFDDAFISRIHVVIHYPDLGQPEQRKIWNQFFDKLEDERKGTLEVDKAAKRYILDNVCKQKWNGREIRNAFQTAVALAEYRFLTRTHKEEGEVAVLEEKDFKQVCDMTVEFKNYLTEVNDGEDEFARAGTGRLRHHIE